MGKKPNRAAPQWRVMDVHIHTPASGDYQQPGVSYLEVLQRAEARGLDIMAITDHNTVAGYRRIREEIDQLELLEKLNRMLPEERSRLAEYRRLFSKILVLPGVEITATFGFHILAIFSPDKPIRQIEHILLDLNIPPSQLDEGSATVGATDDVLTVYRTVVDAGGLVIAAHANSSNGVAMRGFNFGGQTKIAYTQDTCLHALEVTDLEVTGVRSTAAFFNGTKPEYPRRMHCIQGSDAHRLIADPVRKKNLGIGDRATDVLISEVSFEALKELFTSNDFSRTRPHRHKEEPAYDFLQAALEDGSNIVQEFHESMTVRGGKLYAVIADTCAFANTNGGTLYIGISPEPRKGNPPGVPVPEESIRQLSKEISNRISPPLQCTIDSHEHRGKRILRVLVPRGDDPPYAVDDNKIYVRNEAETALAVRDEIVGLVLRGAERTAAAQAAAAPAPVARRRGKAPVEEPPEEGPEGHAPRAQSRPDRKRDAAPRTGVEVLPPVERDGGTYYTMRDLRNGNVVKNVTRSSARRLWAYAIAQYQQLPPSLEDAVKVWQGDFGLLRRYQQGKNSLYDLAMRTPEAVRLFFGVTSDGVHGPWKELLGEEDAG